VTIVWATPTENKRRRRLNLSGNDCTNKFVQVYFNGLTENIICFDFYFDDLFESFNKCGTPPDKSPKIRHCTAIPIKADQICSRYF